MKHVAFLFIIIIVASCSAKKTETKESVTSNTNTIIKYAEGFKVTSLGKATRVEVTYPFQGATSGYTYLLVHKGDEIPDHDAKTKVIIVPLSSIVCTSTTHIPFLNYLGETNALVGFPSTDYISSDIMRARVDGGKVLELGIDKGINMERLVSLKPDMVMGYTMSSDYGQFKKMEELGIKVVINAEYLEKHPLGRAEWIKFMALFFDKEKIADSVFNAIEKEYIEVKAKADSIKQRPTVLSGIVYGDAWFLPGGENYASRLFRDAGGNYIYGDDTSNGFLQLSFESVYNKAHNTDYWIGVGSFNTLQEIKDADVRYAKFDPFIKKQVYTYNARMGAKGGSEFMELGYLRPDLILKDLVKILHPEVLPDYQLYFHKKLE